MNRTIAKAAAAVLASIVLTGCGGSNTYQPAGTDIEHAVYAGKANYPYDSHSELGVHIFATVAPDATITLYNAGDESYADFELWVNKLYTLHMKKLDAKSTVSIAPKDVYNTSASNLVNMPASTITNIQMYVGSSQKLIDVQGPIVH
jgi:predicted small secreted protein